jgi:hypothetical protein
MHQSAPDHLDPKTLILIWDTGASAGLTPFWSDFIDYVKYEIDVCNITKYWHNVAQIRQQKW